MDSVERSELYLRLRAERLLDTTHSAWREVDTGAVQHVIAIAEALVALRVIDNTTFTSVLSDLELGGWMRQRVLGEVARIRAVLTEALSPPRPAWPPTVLACPLAFGLAAEKAEDAAELHLCWLTRAGRGGPTSTLLRLTPATRRMPSDESVGEMAARLELDHLVLVDDRGASYELDWAAAAREPVVVFAAGDTGLAGVDLRATVEPDPPSTVRQLELRMKGATVRRADCGAPPPCEVMTRRHETMSPAQIYLANQLGLLPHGVASGSQQLARGGPAAVAAAFVDLGLIDAGDDLVRRAREYKPPSPDLASSAISGSDRANEGPVGPHPVGSELGLQGVSVFLEGYVLSGRHLTFYLQLAEGPRRVTEAYAGPPWFGLIDDCGSTYRLSVRSKDGRRIHVSLMSGLAPDVRAARFFVDTPFESAWIDLDLSSLREPPTPHPPTPRPPTPQPSSEAST